MISNRNWSNSTEHTYTYTHKHTHRHGKNRDSIVFVKAQSNKESIHVPWCTAHTQQQQQHSNIHKWNENKPMNTAE